MESSDLCGMMQIQLVGKNSSKYMYVIVAPANVEFHWPKVAPWIAQAISAEPEMQQEDLEVIKQNCLRGTSQIWIGHDERGDIELVCVTELHMLGKELTCVVRWLSGINVDNWTTELDTYIEHWAKERGCLKLQIWGRRGWQRALKPLGYIHEFTVIGRRIDREVH